MDSLKWQLQHSETNLDRYKEAFAEATKKTSHLEKRLRGLVATIGALISSAPDQEPGLGAKPKEILIQLWKERYEEACGARTETLELLRKAKMHRDSIEQQVDNFSKIVLDLKKQIDEEISRTRFAGTTPRPRQWEPPFVQDKPVKRDTAAPAPSFKTRVAEWYNKTTTLFLDYHTLSTFPTPPIQALCFKPSCRQTPGPLAPACKCSVKTAFLHVKHLDLKTERRRWHPDKFSSVAEELRCGFKKKAREVFVVVDEMYHATQADVA